MVRFSVPIVPNSPLRRASRITFAYQMENLQRDEILKAEQERNLADAAELARLAGEVKDDFEKNDRYVVSVKTLKKLDDIAKLTRNIHGRLNRY